MRISESIMNWKQSKKTRNGVWGTGLWQMLDIDSQTEVIKSASALVDLKEADSE